MSSTGGTSLKAILLQAAETMMKGNDELNPIFDKQELEAEAIVLQDVCKGAGKGSSVGRKWSIQRNDVNWLFKYELVSEFVSTASWKSLFRILLPLFVHIVPVLRPLLEKQNTV